MKMKDENHTYIYVDVRKVWNSQRLPLSFFLSFIYMKLIWAGVCFCFSSFSFSRSIYVGTQ